MTIHCILHIDTINHSKTSSSKYQNINQNQLTRLCFSVSWTATFFSWVNFRCNLFLLWHKKEEFGTADAIYFAVKMRGSGFHDCIHVILLNWICCFKRFKMVWLANNFTSTIRNIHQLSFVSRVKFVDKNKRYGKGEREKKEVKRQKQYKR